MVQRILLILELVCSAMGSGMYPFDIGASGIDTVENIVCTMDVFDPAHDNHVLKLIPQGQRVVFKGFLTGGCSKYR